MDSHAFFTVWILTAIGSCLCQDRAVGEDVEFRLINPPPAPPFQINWYFGSVLIYAASAGTVNGVVPSYEGRASLDPNTATLELRNLTVNDTGEYTLRVIMSIGQPEKEWKTTLRVFERISSVTLEANQTELVEFNSSVTLTCSASGSSPSFQWFNNSAEVTGSDRVLLDNRTLTVLNVTRYDNGPYRCNASNIVSFEMSSDVTLTIAYGPDSAVVTVEAEYYSSGDNVTLNCSSESSPAAQLQWALNGTLLDEKGPELRLSDVLTSDSGDYNCWAYNSKTQRYKLSSPTSITVLERLSDAAITIAGSPGPLIAGKSSVNLTCEAKGSIITRKWMKNGETLSPETGRITFSDDNRTVSISPVQKEDRGEYTCQVSNPVSNAEGSETLIVKYGPEKVEIKGEGHEGAVEFGQKIHLSCSAESVPDCTYTWTLNGTDKIGTGASFIKENSVYEDSGNYTCTAFNNITKETNKTDFNMSVKAPGSLGGQGGLSAGPIAGIVIGVLVLLAAGGGGIYILTYILKNKR
ncbi:hypothetical protein ACEWY4_019739 [Coilia grayii]|uniref:Ig-like domain-containing protein n=1 Tax=Coilia grayii TaxID=363190 RepID=A0ABD1JAK5_9TELE